jgi:hypothetical protein
VEVFTEESQKNLIRLAISTVAARCRGLHHLLATATGFFETVGLDHPQFGGDEVEDLGDIFADQAQGTAVKTALFSFEPPGLGGLHVLVPNNQNMNIE